MTTRLLSLTSTLSPCSYLRPCQLSWSWKFRRRRPRRAFKGNRLGLALDLAEASFSSAPFWTTLLCACQTELHGNPSSHITYNPIRTSLADCRNDLQEHFIGRNCFCCYLNLSISMLPLSVLCLSNDLTAPIIIHDQIRRYNSLHPSCRSQHRDSVNVDIEMIQFPWLIKL